MIKNAEDPNIRFPARVLGVAPTVHPSSRITDCTLGAWTDIGPYCSIEESSIGDYTYTASDVSIIYTVIGKFCSIGSHVRLNPARHPIERVTQHQITYRQRMFQLRETDDEEFFASRRAHTVTIGNDVWIGHGAIVMPGVSVGDGAVIGSSAVVTKDVSPYMIVGGVPARPIRERFPREIAERIATCRWWDWPREILEERIDDLSDLDRFLERYCPDTESR